MATRQLIRSVVLQSLYEWDFYDRREDLVKILDRNLKEFADGVDEPDFAWRLINGIVTHLNEIDNIIRKAASEWPLEQISLVDRNALRIGVYELVFEDKKEVPEKVAINEAIEIAKNFAGPNAGKFINGVLGSVYRSLEETKKADGKK